VHRIALEVKIGRSLVGDECALHACDNRIYCNPNHLFLGTRLENVQDRAKKGRNGDISGMKNAMCVTSTGQSMMIREEWQRGKISQRALAMKYRLSKGTIWNIINGNHWTKSDQTK
jgi:hypothetical protein